MSPVSPVSPVNGAESLIRTLVDGGVDCCFANPGTSEMHTVQAIDAVPGMRAVLCLFEGVCTGAADGYGRMLGRPAVSLLHLGAGLGNGIANLHNARRGAAPLLNVVGDHAIHHVPYDAPLTADIEGVAAPVSAWVRTARSSTGLALDAMNAVEAALTPNPVPLGNIATLIVPADCAWGPAHYQPGHQPRVPERVTVADEAVAETAGALDATTMLLLDGPALLPEGLAFAGRLAAKTGCRLFAPTFPARVEAGPELPAVQRIPYFSEQIAELLKGFDKLVLAGAQAPVGFFAYQNAPSDPVPAECRVVRLAHRHEDVVGALAQLADRVGADAAGPAAGLARPELPAGTISSRNVAAILGAMLPEQTIIAGDSGGGGAAAPVLQRSIRHSWLSLTGGAIGQGGPAATGAALACPDRQVVALLGDGGAMYTIQCLWTQAREKLSVVTVIYSNRAYTILQIEYRRLGINEIGEKAASMFDLTNPEIDWVAMANSMGVPAQQVGDCETFAAALKEGLSTDGPFLIQVDLVGM